MQYGKVEVNIDVDKFLTDYDHALGEVWDTQHKLSSFSVGPDSITFDA